MPSVPGGWLKAVFGWDEPLDGSMRRTWEVGVQRRPDEMRSGGSGCSLRDGGTVRKPLWKVGVPAFGEQC